MSLDSVLIGWTVTALFFFAVGYLIGKSSGRLSGLREARELTEEILREPTSGPLSGATQDGETA